MTKAKDILKELDQMKKTSPFKVPENYFDQFPLLLQEKLEKKQKTEGWGYKFYRILKSHLALDSSIAGILVIGFIGYKLFSPAVEKNQLTPAEKKQAIEYEVYSTDYGTIIDNMDHSKNVEIKGSDNSAEKSDEIIEYLVGENVETATLAEQL